jgi:hypothetical protein
MLRAETAGAFRLTGYSKAHRQRFIKCFFRFSGIFLSLLRRCLKTAGGPPDFSDFPSVSGFPALTASYG